MKIQYNPIMQELSKLHHQVHQHGVALEAEGIIQASNSILNRFFSFGNKTVSLFKGFVKNLTGSGSVLSPDLTKSLATWAVFKQFAEQYQYGAVTKMPYRVNVGFTGNVAEYSQLLYTIQGEFLSLFINKVLVPVNLTLAKYISQPTLLESVVFDVEIDTKEIEKYKKELAKYIGRGKGIESTIGQCFARMKDIVTLHDNLTHLSSMTSPGKNKKPDIYQVKEEVKGISEKVDILIDILKQQAKEGKVSEVAIRQLSDVLFNVAQQVEFYSLADNLIYSFLGISNENARMLKLAIDTHASLEGIDDLPTVEQLQLAALPKPWQRPEVLSWYHLVRRQEQQQIKHYGTDYFKSPVLSLQDAVELYNQMNEEVWVASPVYNEMFKHWDISRHHTVKPKDAATVYQLVPIAMDYNKLQGLFIDLSPAENGVIGQIINHRGQVVADSFNALLFDTSFLNAGQDNLVQLNETLADENADGI